MEPDRPNEGSVQHRTPTAARATDLTSKRATLAVFVGRRSPQVLLAAATATLILRLRLGDWSWTDLVVVAVVVILTGPVEWVIHRFLLHAEPQSFQMRRLGTGVGHRQHHLDPLDIDYILLRGVDAIVFATLLAVFTAAWAAPVVWFLGTGPAGYVSALAATYVALVNYEWTHLLVHTRYRPHSRLWSNLARNHRLHHYRNEAYWLGVTSNLGDRILGTLPHAMSDVELSDTARTLG